MKRRKTKMEKVKREKEKTIHSFSQVSFPQTIVLQNNFFFCSCVFEKRLVVFSKFSKQKYFCSFKSFRLLCLFFLFVWKFSIEHENYVEHFYRTPSFAHHWPAVGNFYSLYSGEDFLRHMTFIRQARYVLSKQKSLPASESFCFR